MTADHDARRIIDVNVNRAREALRVIEDHARFTLDDADAAAAIKHCRHDLQALRDALGRDALLAARDIVGDVGRDVKADRELARDSGDAIVGAAFGRLSEAARSLGEYAKLIDPSAAARAETLRYRVYELEQRVMLRGTRRQRFRTARLYVLLTAALCRTDWYATAEATIAGGADCIQLREKDLPDGELLRRARRLRALTRDHGVLLAINDRPDIARLVGADLIHVGQDDLAVRDVRHIAGAALLVGKSTHTIEQFDAARVEDPDYLAVGPMFASATKPQDHIAGPATLAAVRDRTPLPLVAIGGIDADNVAAVCAAGADCVAICGGIIAAPDVTAATRTLVQAIRSAKPS
jgi:thiamine-phosphate pyrophosphorylase